MPLSPPQLSAAIRDRLPELHALGSDAPFLWSEVYSQEVLDDVLHGRYDGRGPVYLEDLALTPVVEELLDATENHSVHLWAAVLASRLLFATRDRGLAEMLSRRLRETEGWRLGSLSQGISSLSGHLYINPEISGGRIDFGQFDSAFGAWRDQALQMIDQLAARPRDSAERQELLTHLMELRRQLPPESRQRRIDAACALIASEALADQLDEPFESGDAPLHLAAEYGLGEVIAALLAAGASPDVRGEDALTPLMIAARQGDGDAVRQLLAAGADVEVRDELERTALLWACSRGTGRYDLESIRRLLEAGADPLARAATGQAVAQYARADPELQALVERAGEAPDPRPEGVICRPDALPPDRRRGLAAFIADQLAGHPEWSLVAVAAPIDDVSRAFTELRRPDVVTRDVAHQPVAPAPRLVWLLQLRDADWSVLIYSLSDYVSDLGFAAGDLSQHLDTRAVCFIGEDTSGVGGLHVFDRGERVDGVEVELYDGEEAILDAWAVEHGLFVPPCRLDDDGRQVLLELDGVGIEDVVRVDTFAFGAF